MWIDSVSPEDAKGKLRALYEQQARHLGRPTDITIAGSLYPELVDIRMRLYRVVESCPSSLTSMERQGVALAAAAVAGSDVVTSGVRGKFLSEGGTQEQAASLMRGETAVLNPCPATLARYARKVATDPASLTERDVEQCRRAGARDLDILDANNLAGYYGYLARICLGLGIRGVPS